MSDQTEIPEPLSDEYLNHFSSYMKAMGTVENLIFDFNEEDIPQIWSNFKNWWSKPANSLSFDPICVYSSS